jgi:hypothetical protein
LQVQVARTLAAATFNYTATKRRQGLGVSDDFEHRLALRQADQARTDFAVSKRS